MFIINEALNSFHNFHYFGWYVGVFFCVYIRKKYFLCRCKTDIRSKYPDACHIFMNFKVINTPIKIMFKKHFYFTNHRPAWYFLCLNIHEHFFYDRSGVRLPWPKQKGKENEIKKKKFYDRILKNLHFLFLLKILVLVCCILFKEIPFLTVCSLLTQLITTILFFLLSFPNKSSRVTFNSHQFYLLLLLYLLIVLGWTLNLRTMMQKGTTKEILWMNHMR